MACLYYGSDWANALYVGAVFLLATSMLLALQLRREVLRRRTAERTLERTIRRFPNG